MLLIRHGTILWDIGGWVGPHRPASPPHRALSWACSSGGVSTPRLCTIAREQAGFKQHPLLTPAPSQCSIKENLVPYSDEHFDWLQSPAPKQPARPLLSLLNWVHLIL